MRMRRSPGPANNRESGCWRDLRALTKLLRIPCRVFTAVHFSLDEQTRGVFDGAFPMIQHYALDYLFVLPFALAVIFLVWVFWKFGKQSKR